MPRRNRPVKHQSFLYPSRCQDKRRFSNERQAKDAAERQMLEQPALELNVYKCELCGGWHLTRQTRNS